MDQVNRPHHASKAKKKSKHTGGPNPKAFAFANPGKLEKQAKRSHDLKEKKLHVPLVDRLPEEAPPIVVAVVGPPGTGKTTLIKSLVRRYTKNTLNTIAGPITVVTSKKRRLTFLECDPSLPAMIDTAKIADIVLLLIDGNFGFEMETMEFLNIMSCHGMPSNIFGILTHLDLFRSPATLKTAKKRLKHRFWSELYHGAKLFYLSGVLNGRYPDREVLNLSRFISVMKNPRPIIWRNSHPYMLADRMVDLTDPAQIEDDSRSDRTVALYGYLRGTNFPAVDGRVHIPGVGDLNVTSVEGLVDPCPTPQAVLRMEGKEGTKRRRLGDKQKLLFAPMSDVGGVLVDKDAVYIEMRTNNFTANGENEDGEVVDRDVGERLVVGLQGRQNLLGQSGDLKENGGIRLFSNGEMIRSTDESEGRKTKRSGRSLENGDQEDDEGFQSGEEDDEEMDDENEELTGSEEDSDAEDMSVERSFAMQRKFSKLNGADENIPNEDDIAYAESDSDIGSVSEASGQSFDDDEEIPSDEDDLGSDIDVEDNAQWKSSLTSRASEMHKSMSKDRKKSIKELSKLLYDDDVPVSRVVRLWRNESIEELEEMDSEAGSEDEDDFFKKAERADDADDSQHDRGVPSYNLEALEQKWKENQADMEDLKRRFITANLLDEQEKRLNGDEEGGEDDDFSGFDSDEGDGEFEDLETGEKSEVAEDNESKEENSMEAERVRNARKKEELKLRFEEEADEGLAGTEGNEEFGEDEWYEAQKDKLNKQMEVNKAELEQLDLNNRVRIEGFRPGTYARIVLSGVPCEFVNNFSPKLPILIGGLTPTEDRFGFLQIRIKRHRWHKKILKTNDPLIFSLGWRRFQSVPIYSLSDSRTRNRMLKYTPEHMHCTGTIYGPLIAPNTGFCCVQSVSKENPGFRVAATGVVLNVDEGTEIVKKLKLTGAPHKIFKNTAFIKDMFSSSLEVAKFEGASIKTVSGIRGQIKRALSKPDGYYRATFEDKILMSDIVFLRAWYPVKPRKFYNPMTNLLGEKGWTGMRLTGQVRYEEGIKTPLLADSKYKKIERPTRNFNPLKVPKGIQKELPFKSQIRAMKPQKKETYLQKRAIVVGGEEKKARDLMLKLQTLRNDKVEKRRAAKEEKRKVYRAKVAENIEMKEARERKEGKEYWKKEGRKRGAGEDGGPTKSKKRRSRASGDNE